MVASFILPIHAELIFRLQSAVIKLGSVPGNIMPFTPHDYLQRAAKLEALADQASDSATRISYLQLAQRFRDTANLAGVSQMQSDVEIMRLAERMVGKASRAS